MVATSLLLLSFSPDANLSMDRRGGFTVPLSLVFLFFLSVFRIYKGITVYLFAPFFYLQSGMESRVGAFYPTFLTAFFLPSSIHKWIV